MIVAPTELRCRAPARRRGLSYRHESYLLLEQKSSWFPQRAEVELRSTGFALASLSRRRSSLLVASPLLSRAFNALRAPHPLVLSIDGAQLPSVFNTQHIVRRREL